jgi:hypothetical protein
MPKIKTQRKRLLRKISNKKNIGGVSLTKIAVGLGLFLANMQTVGAVSVDQTPKKKIEVFCEQIETRKTKGALTQLYEALFTTKTTEMNVALNLAKLGIGMDPAKICTTQNGVTYLSKDIKEIVPGSDIAGYEREDHAYSPSFKVKYGWRREWNIFYDKNKRAESKMGAPCWSVVVFDKDYRHYEEGRIAIPEPIEIWKEKKKTDSTASEHYSGSIMWQQSGGGIDFNTPTMAWNPNNIAGIIYKDGRKEIVIINGDNIYDENFYVNFQDFPSKVYSDQERSDHIGVRENPYKEFTSKVIT